ncbi:MAG: SDR family NAD(P)-dependent oxidoreductase [Thermoleophilaceae bacterium]
MELAPGTRVLVTGASKGIGAIVARAFAEHGCTLGLVARVAPDAAALPGQGHEAFAADVADRAAIAAVVESFGPDVVVANAGVAHYSSFPELDLDKAERMTHINWLGTLYTVAPALARMTAQRRGHVVVVSSGAGIRAFPGASVYGATKAAQRGFAEALRHELDGTGVSVTVVYPGQLATALHDHEKGSLPAWYTGAKSAPPEPIGGLVVRAVERDRPEVFYPSNVRSLRVFHGLSPRIADALLRRIRGRSAAPRRG